MNNPSFFRCQNFKIHKDKVVGGGKVNLVIFEAKSDIVRPTGKMFPSEILLGSKFSAAIYVFAKTIFRQQTKEYGQIYL